MAKGSCELPDLLKEKQKGLNFIKIFPIFKDIIVGTSYIHCRFLTHGDIKPANIVCNNGSWMITDFGETKLIEMGINEAVFATTVGSPLYASP